MQVLEQIKYSTKVSDVQLDELKKNMRVYSPEMRCHGQIVEFDKSIVHIVWGMRIYRTGTWGRQYACGTRGYTKARWYNMDNYYLVD